LRQVLRSVPAYRDTSRQSASAHAAPIADGLTPTPPLTRRAPMRCAPAPVLPPTHIAAKFRSATTRPERSRPCASAFARLRRDKPPRRAHYARRSPGEDAGLHGTRAPGKGSCQAALCEDDRAPLVTPLACCPAGPDPAQKTKQILCARGYAHARRLPGGDPSARRIKSCFVPCAPTARAIDYPQAPASGGCAAPSCLGPRRGPGALVAPATGCGGSRPRTMSGAPWCCFAT